jgi:hypothetical protein
MPKLLDIRSTKKITLPSFDGSKVEIYDSLLVGDMVDIDYKEDNKIKLTLDILPKFIKSWNFTDEEGKELEITKENLGFLKEDDVKFIVDEITALAEASKKKLKE